MSHDSRVYRVHSIAGAQEAAVAAISLVDQGVTPGAALDHRVEVPGGSLGRVMREAFILKQGFWSGACCEIL